jgi:hypothetical protein
MEKLPLNQELNTAAYRDVSVRFRAEIDICETARRDVRVLPD